MSATTRSRPDRRSGAGIALTATVVAVAALGALALLTRPDTGDLPRTGEVNAMGVPVVATPGDASGMVSVLGIDVTAANWELGQVPLDVAVLPTWTLENTSDATVALGEPHAEVVAGCCPGPLTLDTTELAPGESTELTFDLAMHQGMDGWHDLDVHVPVEPVGDGDVDVLTLNVTGHFGDRAS